MKDCVLIQHGSNGHEACLSVTMAAHQRYAEIHGMDYQASCGDCSLGGRHPMWSKVYLLRESLRRGYEKAIWLDADTLIVDHETDLRRAVPGLQVGMTYHSYEWAKIGIGDVAYDHWNTGAVYCGAGDFTHNTLLVWWNTPDENHPWHDQHGFNRALIGCRGAQVVELDWKWNSIFPLFESPAPVVRHWAGWQQLPIRAETMKRAVEKLTWI